LQCACDGDEWVLGVPGCIASGSYCRALLGGIHWSKCISYVSDYSDIVLFAAGLSQERSFPSALRVENSGVVVCIVLYVLINRS